MNDLECTHNSDSKDPSQKPASGIQNILVFQQNGSGIKKIEGVKLYGNNHFSLQVVSIDAHLPRVIDDTKEYIPGTIEADLVLDYLKHPDLSYDLAVVCRDKKIPVVASGKKFSVKGAFTPPTWCALSRQVCLGHYGNMFGAPEFAVTVVDGIVTRITVLRGAPCGATWETARRVENLPVEEAIIRIGLDVQFYCIADPAGWDPIYGKSPVHLAGKFHTAALKKALKRS